MRGTKYGRDVQNSRINKAKGNDHRVGGRAPKTQGGHHELSVHVYLDGREFDDIKDAESSRIIAEAWFHSSDPSSPSRNGRRLDSLGFDRLLLRPIIPLEQGFQTVGLQHIGDNFWDIILEKWAKDLVGSIQITFKSEGFDGVPVNKISALVTFLSELGDEVLVAIDEDLNVFWVLRFGFFFGLRPNGKKFWRFEGVKGEVNLD